MDQLLIELAARGLGIGLAAAGLMVLWVSIRVFNGDRLAFRQERRVHPTPLDALLGRSRHGQPTRPDDPAASGIVLKMHRGKRSWRPQRAMSDEQYADIAK